MRGRPPAFLDQIDEDRRKDSTPTRRFVEHRPEFVSQHPGGGAQYVLCDTGVEITDQVITQIAIGKGHE